MKCHSECSSAEDRVTCQRGQVVRPHLETQDSLSSPPAWSWARPGFPGWVVPMLLPHPLAWTEAPCQCLCPPVSWAFAPDVFSPWDAFHGVPC